MFFENHWNEDSNSAGHTRDRIPRGAQPKPDNEHQHQHKYAYAWLFVKGFRAGVRALRLGNVMPGAPSPTRTRIPVVN